jgi:sec-independent protein translocase protein TatB
MGAPPQILLGNLGMADSLILMVLALVVFGPRRLPQIGRQIGKLMYEFRKASNDFKFQMEEELRAAEDSDRRKKEEEERARTLALNPPAETQTIEAQASVGAVEQASVSAQPPAVGPASPYAGEPPAVGLASPYAGEETYPPVTTESTPAEPEQRIYPRISPPSTGETVAQARYGASGSTSEPAAAEDAGVAAEANIGAEPAPAAAAEPPASTEPTPSTESSRTETVSQHG